MYYWGRCLSSSTQEVQSGTGEERFINTTYFSSVIPLPDYLTEFIHFPFDVLFMLSQFCCMWGRSVMKFLMPWCCRPPPLKHWWRQWVSMRPCWSKKTRWHLARDSLCFNLLKMHCFFTGSQIQEKYAVPVDKAKVYQKSKKGWVAQTTPTSAKGLHLKYLTMPLAQSRVSHLGILNLVRAKLNISLCGRSL